MEGLLSKIERRLTRGKSQVRNPRLYALFHFLFGCSMVILNYLWYLDKVAREQAFEARLGIAQDTQEDFYLLLVWLALGLAHVALAGCYAVPDRWPRVVLGLIVAVILLLLLFIVALVIGMVKLSI